MSRLNYCADWHDKQAADLRRFVDEYPRDGISMYETHHLAMTLVSADNHEAWAKEIRSIINNNEG